MKKKIVIAEYVSTGINLVYDVLSRGYEPVLLDCPYIAAEEDLNYFTEYRKSVKATLPEGLTIIEENHNYEEVLEQVRALDPLFIIAGSEFGVPYATRLADDLGLPGNSKKNLKAMTEKDSMHEALKNYGIRYIRGKVIESVEEAKAFYEELGVTEQMVPEEINEKISSQLAQKYEPIGGVSFEVVSEEDRAKIVMTIDCKKVNVEKLVEFGILSEGEEGSGAISLETLKNGLEQDEAYGCEIQ